MPSASVEAIHMSLSWVIVTRSRIWRSGLFKETFRVKSNCQTIGNLERRVISLKPLPCVGQIVNILPYTGGQVEDRRSSNVVLCDDTILCFVLGIPS